MPADDAIILAPAGPSDAGAILFFIQELARYEKLAHELEVTEELLREYLFGPRPAAEAILAKIGDKAVGFALFFTTYSTFVGLPGIWLEDLFVLPEHRRKGVGRKLLQRVAQIAVERNFGRLEWSVLDWNEMALRVYRKIGAEPMSDWTTQRLVGEDLIRLAEG
jgi:GNAT superfamily N-acetyltransferase